MTRSTVALPAEDPALLENLRAGNHDAFAALVHANTGRLLAVARRMLRQEQEAQDAVQEAFLSAFKALSSFEGQCRLSTWLHRIAVNACLMLAAQTDGRQVLTIEGLATKDKLHPLQKVFEESGALQCGFCGPGMLLSAKALLDENPEPSVYEIRDALAGNLCRCTGYSKIVEAVQDAARMRQTPQAHEAHQLEMHGQDHG